MSTDDCSARQVGACSARVKGWLAWPAVNTSTQVAVKLLKIGKTVANQHFAKLELKTFLATLLRKYTIRSLTRQEDITLNFAIIAQSLTSIKMEFTSRVKTDKSFVC